MSSELVTIPNIELVSTGSWDASTGPVTFTQDDLRSALAACDDPAVKEPRLIVGHTSSKDGPTMSPHEGFFGEQPALGRFTNLRMANNDQTIVGDLVGVPKWLADILPTAYPNRSIEGFWNVKSATGKDHAFIIPRIAVLGVSLPAVATLEDLQATFSEDGPEGVQLVHYGERVAAQTQVRASVQYEDVRRAFYSDFAVDDKYWWWIRSIYVDPSKLIVDDDEGGLFAVPYTVSGDGTTFGEPAEIFTQYVEKDSGKVAASVAEKQWGNMLHAYASASQSRPADHNKTKEIKMGIDVPALRGRLGLTAEQLPDDATEEQVNQALTGEVPAPADKPVTDVKEVPAPTAPAPVAPAPDVQQGSAVQVDAAAWAEAQAEIKASRDERAARQKADREAYVSAAIKAGKIPPARRDHYVAIMHADPEGTVALLDSLEVGLAAPVDEIGGDDVSGVKAANDYPLEWLRPEERQKVEASRKGELITVPRIVLEAS